MTQQHPIAPPPELVEQWFSNSPIDRGLTIAIQAAQWGADQELKACCEWMADETPTNYINALRAARRPKPPSLKEQALGALYAIATGADDTREFHQDLETIKTGLESLPD